MSPTPVPTIPAPPPTTHPTIAGTPSGAPAAHPTGTPTAAATRPRSLTGDDGMSTVEYAIGTIAAAAFAAILYTVLSGDSIVTALTDLVQRALTATF